MKNKVVITCIFSCILPCLTLRSDEQRSILSRIPAGAKSTSHAPAHTQKAKPSRSSGLLKAAATPETQTGSSLVPSMPTPPDIKLPQSKPSASLESKDVELPAPDPAPAPHQTASEKDALAHGKEAEESEQKIRFYFQDATLENVAKYMETIFKVTFLPDDAVKPIMSGMVPLEGHKVSFKTNRPLSRTEAWNTFLRLLELSGLTVVAGLTPDFYQITSIDRANHEPLPVYFDSPENDLPDNSIKIRYVYFVKNIQLASVHNIMTSLASTTAKIIPFTELNAVIITDKATNIRSLMKIIRELDKEMPEAMSVLKLEKSDATKVADLYNTLVKNEGSNTSRFANQRKSPAAIYFPADARIIPEPRTNSLILLGSKTSLAKIESFIIKNIDTEIALPYSPLHVYTLQNTSAANIAGILQKVISFGSSAPAGQSGGVRDGQKYFRAGSISITPEPSTNKLVIKAEEDDYKKLKEMIEILDVDQPQVAVEALIVNTTSTENKGLSSQLRNKNLGSIVRNMNMQSAQIGSPVTGAAGGLLGNLIGLATGSNVQAGTTLLSIGSDATNGVWGLFAILQAYTDSKVVQNPFLLATNKYQSTFTYGTTRRVINATLGSSTSSVGDKTANLTLKVTPQINSDGIITMDIDITSVEFTDDASATDPSAANTTTWQITTTVHINDQDVLVLGGITQNILTENVTKVPVLGDIPILGSLFRGKGTTRTLNNILVFLSPKIVKTASEGLRTEYHTHIKTEEARYTLQTTQNLTANRNQILDKAFFGRETGQDGQIAMFEQFVSPEISELNSANALRPVSPNSTKITEKKPRSKAKKPSYKKRLARRTP